QRGHCQAETDHGAPVLHEVIRIGHAVPLDVRPLVLRRVGPPVIAFAEEIVLAPRAPRAARGGDRQRCLAEIPASCLENAGTFDGGEIELRGSQGAANRGDGERGGEKRTALHTNASLTRYAPRDPPVFAPAATGLTAAKRPSLSARARLSKRCSAA